MYLVILILLMSGNTVLESQFSFPGSDPQNPTAIILVSKNKRLSGKNYGDVS